MSSDVVATLPQGTQVVVEAQLLTSDVDHTIEEVRQEVQQQQIGLPCGGAVSRASANRTLFCRKCEGHGQQVVLKGHASRCPYNNCQCKTCTNVMSMRANAIIRRYRTRTLEGGLVLKPVHFKNGNTRLRVFPKYVDDSDALTIPIGQQQQLLAQAQAQVQAQAQAHQQNHQQAQQIQPPHQLQQQQTPPQSAVPNGNEMQPPFPVKRSYSDDLDVLRASDSPKRSSLEQSPTTIDLQQQQNQPNTLGSLQLSLIDELLRKAPELLASGLLPIATQSVMSTMPSHLYDTGNHGNLFSGITFPNANGSTYSSATTYANSFMTNGFGNTTDIIDRKMSDASLIQPAAMQLSELNIGVTTTSPVNNSMVDLAPKLTPNMFESACTVSEPPKPDEPQAEPFSRTFMIAPTADRHHPLFKKLLKTVKELERQMLVDEEEDAS